MSKKSEKSDLDAVIKRLDKIEKEMSNINKKLFFQNRIITLVSKISSDTTFLLSGISLAIASLVYLENNPENLNFIVLFFLGFALAGYNLIKILIIKIRMYLAK